MFIDVHELALHKIPIRKSYTPGTLDFHSNDFRQVEPLREGHFFASFHSGTLCATGDWMLKINAVFKAHYKDRMEEQSTHRW